jgi:hypothetical protein
MRQEGPVGSGGVDRGRQAAAHRGSRQAPPEWSSLRRRCEENAGRRLISPPHQRRIFRPHGGEQHNRSCRIYRVPEDDPIDDAKALLASLTYGQTRSSYTRGNITMPDALLRALTQLPFS